MNLPAAPPVTPDGRYIVVPGRLWRAANPGLKPNVREQLTRALMAARRAIGSAPPKSDLMNAARSAVDKAKRALGERDPIWWRDGAPDYNRRMAKNTLRELVRALGSERLGNRGE